MAFLNNLSNKQLKHHDIVTLNEIKETQCLFTCAQNDGCGSVNYHQNVSIVNFALINSFINA